MIGHFEGPMPDAAQRWAELCAAMDDANGCPSVPVDRPGPHHSIWRSLVLAWQGAQGSRPPGSHRRGLGRRLDVSNHPS